MNDDNFEYNDLEIHGNYTPHKETDIAISNQCLTIGNH